MEKSVNKAWYLMMHFGDSSVTGMISVAPDPETARKQAIAKLTPYIKYLEKKYPGDEFFMVQRFRAFRRSLAKPWRVTKETKSAVLLIREIEPVMIVGYWLDHLIPSESSEHICNLPTKWTQDPLGYYVAAPVES